MMSKWQREERKRERIINRRRPWLFINAIKYRNLDWNDDSLKAKLKRKIYSFLKQREYKKYKKYQKTLQFLHNANMNGYYEYTDIFNFIIYLTTCMGIEYKNFSHTVDETVKEEVRSLWKFRRMVKDYLRIEDTFADKQDAMIKRKYGQNTDLRMNFEVDNEEYEKKGLRSCEIEYAGNDTGSKEEIMGYRDAINSDPNFGSYPPKDVNGEFIKDANGAYIDSAEEKFTREFFKYMMDFFYKHYRRWWD